MAITRSYLNKLRATVSASAPPASRNSRTSSVTKSPSNDRVITRSTRFANVDDDNSHESTQKHSVSSSSNSKTNTRCSLFTSSARKASLRNHKIYAPAPRRSSRASIPRDVLTYDHQVQHEDHEEVVIEQFEGGDYDDDENAENDVCDTADILASLASSSQGEQLDFSNSPMELCLNPVSSEMCYVYNFVVYNPTGEQMYSSSYILYNMKNRTYYLLNKLALVYQSYSQELHIEPSSPYFLQTKYSSYMRDSIDKYIQNLLVFREVPQSIETRFIGLVTSEQTIGNIFNGDGCYYDVDSLFNSKSSTETLNGSELFVLTPTIYYSNTTFTENIQDILTVLSGQH